MRASLAEPNFLKIAYSFISNTAFWLTQVVLNVDVNDQEGAATYAPLKERELQLPLHIQIAETLK